MEEMNIFDDNAVAKIFTTVQIENLLMEMRNDLVEYDKQFTLGIK